MFATIKRFFANLFGTTKPDTATADAAPAPSPEEELDDTTTPTAVEETTSEPDTLPETEEEVTEKEPKRTATTGNVFEQMLEEFPPKQSAAPERTSPPAQSPTATLAKPELVRPEFNVEKHADLIFSPSHSNKLDRPVKRTWMDTMPDGTKVKASVMVDTYRKRIPTTKTRKVYLALCKMYERKGWDGEERTVFSMYELSQELGLEWAGKKTIDDLKRELYQLRGTMIDWEFSFVDDDGGYVTMSEPISILDSFRFKEKQHREQDELFTAQSSFRFNEYIRANLKGRKTKPLNYDVALSLKGEIAQLLYGRLDLIMADKTKYERVSKGVLEDIRLEWEKAYPYPSDRKRALAPAVKELNGQPITTGVLKLTLERTKDKKDWKLVARKTPSAAPERKHLPARVVEPANPAELIPVLADDIEKVLGQSEKRSLYKAMAKHYSDALLYRALSEFKADGGRTADNRLAFFLGILKRLTHEQGLLWFGKTHPGVSDLQGQLFSSRRSPEDLN